MLEPPIKAETLTNNKAPSLLVLLHHHDTQLSRLQIVPSGAPIVEQLLWPEGCTGSREGSRRCWLHSILTKVLCCLGLRYNQTRATVNGNESKCPFFRGATNFDQDWALPDLTWSIVAMTRQDSDLEAFSHNPTDGSFTALLARATVCANCPNLRFLSY